MLRISTLKWKYKEFNNIDALIKLMQSKFKLANITTKISTTGYDDVISFSDVKDGKTFISSVNNKIVLKDNDPRIKKTGRKFLLSNRPTEEQYKEFFNVIQSTLDDIGLYASVELIIPRTSETIILRDGLLKYNTYPTMKSFPLKLNEGDIK